jgi:hypothetical protein
MHQPITPLKNHQTFCFTCSPQVACFNACCRDLNQVLTPYDVLCLKEFLNMPSGDFLEAHTPKKAPVPEPDCRWSACDSATQTT